MMGASTSNLPRLNLRAVNSDKPELLYIVYRHTRGASKFVYSTGVKVLPKHWSKDGQVIKNVAAVRNARSLNAFLQGLIGHVQDLAADQLRESAYINNKVLAASMDKYTNRSKGESVALLAATFSEGARGSTMANLAKLLIKFEDANKGKKVMLSDVTHQLVEDFRSWLNELGKAPGYINGLFASFKRVMKLAYLRGMTKNNIYINDDLFRHKAVKHHEIALSYEQVLLLYNVEITRLIDGGMLYDRRIASCKRDTDAFIVDCLTGLRHSDISRIDPDEHIVKEGDLSLFRIIPKKTQRSNPDPIYIPIHPIVLAILENYEYQMPKMSSMSMYKKNIRLAAFNAGLVEVVERSVHKGNVSEFERVPFYTLVRPHTARRTLATILLDQGFSVDQVKTIGGWSSDSSFRRYDRRKRKQIAVNMADHPFWKSMRAV